MKYYISTDKSLLQLEPIHEFITNHSYWGKGRTLAEVQGTIENSLCFGMYTMADEQIGFARVVTDYVFFGYFMDVIIFKKFQGKGYGKKFLEFILEHEVIKRLKTLALKTKDAHMLYEKFGFKKVGDSPLWMAIDKQQLL
jgi:GNAT superfamily N-acetyltransferase